MTGEERRGEERREHAAASAAVGPPGGGARALPAPSEPKPVKRTPNADLWDALKEALEFEPESGSERGAWNAAIGKMLASTVPVVPGEIAGLVAAWPEVFGDATCTPNGLEAHLGRLRHFVKSGAAGLRVVRRGGGGPRESVVAQGDRVQRQRFAARHGTGEVLTTTAALAALRSATA